jgi:hypothetical protein
VVHEVTDLVLVYDSFLIAQIVTYPSAWTDRPACRYLVRQTTSYRRVIGHGNHVWKTRLLEVRLHLSLHRDLADTCCEFLLDISISRKAAK